MAIATGEPGPDVLDVDRHEDGDGFAAFNRLKRAGMLAGARALVRTRSGGLHAYYTGTSQPCGALRAHHLDFKAAGGYVLAPPSVVGGRPYELLDHRPATARLDWAAVRSLLDPPKPAPRRPGKPGKGLDALAAWVAAQPEGNRNKGLYWAACRAAETGHDPGELLDAAIAAGLGEAAARATIDAAAGGCEHEPGRPRHHPRRRRAARRRRRVHWAPTCRCRRRTARGRRLVGRAHPRHRGVLVTPRLILDSAEPESGKTRVLELLSLITRAPIFTMNTTIAALYRRLIGAPRTILLDETDAVFAKGAAQNHEDLRALLNAGYKRGATVDRCVGDGATKVVEFPASPPAALAGYRGEHAADDHHPRGHDPHAPPRARRADRRVHRGGRAR